MPRRPSRAARAREDWNPPADAARVNRELVRLYSLSARPSERVATVAELEARLEIPTERVQRALASLALGRRARPVLATPELTLWAHSPA